MVAPARELIPAPGGSRPRRVLGATTVALFAFASLTAACGDDEIPSAPDQSSPPPVATTQSPVALEERALEERALDPESDGEPATEVYEGPPRVRLVIIHPAPLLGSEMRGFERLTRGLTSAGFNVLDGEPTTAETEYARAWLAETPLDALPENWSELHGVIILEAFPPVPLRDSRRRARVSGGIGSTLTLRPPSTEPMLEERAGPGSLRILRGSTAEGWLNLFLPLMQATLEDDSTETEAESE